MIAVWSGKTAAARSRKVSGVSGWKFAGLRSRSVSYGAGAIARSSVETSLAGCRAKDQLPPKPRRHHRSGVGEDCGCGLSERQDANSCPRRIDRQKRPVSQLLLCQLDGSDNRFTKRVRTEDVATQLDYARASAAGSCQYG